MREKSDVVSLQQELDKYISAIQESGLSSYNLVSNRFLENGINHIVFEKDEWVIFSLERNKKYISFSSKVKDELLYKILSDVISAKILQEDFERKKTVGTVGFTQREFMQKKFKLLNFLEESWGKRFKNEKENLYDFNFEE